ncbi:MAG: MbnP family copper-binding protein, partial [Kangiellaceae bacterium]|nr:MbnP family copper-binding protein [Kangiellaceae bacterium]
EFSFKSIDRNNNYVILAFEIGVPFELNHLNPLTQEFPLNQPDMFWAWRNGHKFLRLELSAVNEDWLFHLGSTGCNSAAPVRAPEQECLQPNRIHVHLNLKQGSIDTNNSINIVADLSKLFDKIDLAKSNGCQSDPNDPNCPEILEQIGAGESAQRLFRLK